MIEYKNYYNNRQIRDHYWKNEKGQYEGESKMWHESGQLIEHCFFKNDLYNSEYKSWYKNGQQEEQGFFKNGLLQGEYKSWLSNGQLVAHCFFHNHKIIDITEYVADKNNITESEYFHLQLTFGYFPIIKYNGKP